MVLEGYVVLLGVMLNCGESCFVGGGSCYVVEEKVVFCGSCCVVVVWSWCFVFYVSQ